MNREEVKRKILSWRQKTNKDLQISNKPISDKAKAAFRRAPYGGKDDTEGSNWDIEKRNLITKASGRCSMRIAEKSAQRLSWQSKRWRMRKGRMMTEDECDYKGHGYAERMP